MNEDKVKVIFIGGYGRSGSTILDCVLGQIEGFVSSGELRFLWERGITENQLCGCGNPFRKCLFWQAVIESVFGKFENVDVGRIIALKKSVDRLRYIPNLIYPPLQSRKYREQFLEYSELYIKLYRAIREVSGSEFIVDSSKDPSYAYFLASLSKGIELWTIHLARDSRAVSHSWQRSKRRPEIYWRDELMPRYNPIKSSWEWNWMNVVIGSMRFFKPDKYLFLRYEDIVLDPEKVMNMLLNRLGKCGVSLGIKENFIWLKDSHTVSGNPLRFQKGKIAISPDDEWKEKMSISHKCLVSLLTWPLLMRYGYINLPKSKR